MNLKSHASKELMPGFHGKMVHGNQITWAFWTVKKGAIVPEHQHPHEQIMYVLEGEFRLSIEGKSKVYKKNDYVVISSNVSHEGEALTDCKLMDVFSPVREDYI